MPLLDREEYIEQAYFFRVFRERLEENFPAQEILADIGEEILATTRLPMAIDFLRGELMHLGQMSDGMKRLTHYFTPFQAYIIERAEADGAKFDQRTALEVLQREAEYRSESSVPTGAFIYQFESLARNRLGYNDGLLAISEDPIYDADWKEWILQIRYLLGSVDFAELIYSRSEMFAEDAQKKWRASGAEEKPLPRMLFGRQEGRIAKAHRGKEPLFLFGALQRQLNYPIVPRVKREPGTLMLHPELEARLTQIEKRLQVLDADAKDKLDLKEFYVNPPAFTDDVPTDFPAFLKKRGEEFPK